MSIKLKQPTNINAVSDLVFSFVNLVMRWNGYVFF